MSGGAGLSDAEKLAAARELAAMFKKGGSESDRGGGRKRNQRNATPVHRNENIPPPRQHQPPPRQHQAPPRQHQPPPRQPPVFDESVAIRTTPLPSQRRYEDSLSMNPFQRGPGPIMGSRAMDFLSRRDEPKTTAVNPPLAQPKPASLAPVTVPSVPEPAASSQQKETTGKAIANSVKTSEGNKILQEQAVPSAKLPLGQIRQNGTASSTTDSSSAMPTPSASAPLDQQKPPRQTVKDTFFSLIGKPRIPDGAVSAPVQPKVEVAPASDTAMKQSASDHAQGSKVEGSMSRPDFSNMSKAPPVKVLPHATTLSVINTSTAVTQKTSATPQTELEAQSKNVTLPVAGNGKHGSVPIQRSVGGKTDELKSSEAPKQLRPEAPGFIPRATTNTDSLSIPVNNNTIALHSSPHVELNQHGNVAHVMNLLSELASSAPIIIPTSLTSGHLLSVTPVQYANGVLIAGHTDGRVWPTDTPSNPVDQQYAPPGPKALETAKARPTQKKPTVGLGGPMWAK